MLEIAAKTTRFGSVHITGADVQSLCQKAFKCAIHAKINSTAQDLEDSDQIVISDDDFCNALEQFTPSLSSADIIKYDSIGRQYDSNVV